MTRQRTDVGILGTPNGGAVMQSAGLAGLPTAHNRMLVTGAIFAAIGGLLGLIGAVLGGAAITATLREWAQSEQSQQLVSKARAAANAAAKSGAAAWQGPAD
jgi:hypothetical protein